MRRCILYFFDPINKTHTKQNGHISCIYLSLQYGFNHFQLECCAVNAVTGTTNDFDSTPWVTGGSAGSKNVPIFCCSGIDANSAGAAFTACTDSVSTGYYGIVSFETSSHSYMYLLRHCMDAMLQTLLKYNHFWN